MTLSLMPVHGPIFSLYFFFLLNHYFYVLRVQLHTIVYCCFELLLFSVILCYALWHKSRYSAEGVTEFICCNQTLGLFIIIIIINGAQAPRQASDTSIPDVQ